MAVGGTSCPPQQSWVEVGIGRNTPLMTQERDKAETDMTNMVTKLVGDAYTKGYNDGLGAAVKVIKALIELPSERTSSAESKRKEAYGHVTGSLNGDKDQGDGSP